MDTHSVMTRLSCALLCAVCVFSGCSDQGNGMPSAEPEPSDATFASPRDDSAPEIMITSSGLADSSGAYLLEGVVRDDVEVSRTEVQWRTASSARTIELEGHGRFEASFQLAEGEARQFLEIDAFDAAGNRARAIHMVRRADPSGFEVLGDLVPGGIVWLDAHGARDDDDREPPEWFVDGASVGRGDRVAITLTEPGAHTVALRRSAEGGELARVLEVEDPAGLGESLVRGFVHDEDGGPLRGVLIKDDVGEALARTDHKGAFTISLPRGAVSVLTLEREGLATRKMRAVIPGDRLSHVLDARMAHIDATRFVIDPDDPDIVTAPGGVELDPSSRTLSGQDTVALHISSVADGAHMARRLDSVLYELIDVMGSVHIDAVRGSSSLGLGSYGALIPVRPPAGGLEPGERLSVFAFDATSGLWEEVGSGVVEAAEDAESGFAARTFDCRGTSCAVGRFVPEARLDLAVTLGDELLPDEEPTVVRVLDDLGSFALTSHTIGSDPEALMVPAARDLVVSAVTFDGRSRRDLSVAGVHDGSMTVNLVDLHDHTDPRAITAMPGPGTTVGFPVDGRARYLRIAAPSGSLLSIDATSQSIPVELFVADGAAPSGLRRVLVGRDTATLRLHVTDSEPITLGIRPSRDRAGDVFVSLRAEPVRGELELGRPILDALEDGVAARYAMYAERGAAFGLDARGVRPSERFDVLVRGASSSPGGHWLVAERTGFHEVTITAREPRPGRAAFQLAPTRRPDATPLELGRGLIETHVPLDEPGQILRFAIPVRPHHGMHVRAQIAGGTDTSVPLELEVVLPETGVSRCHGFAHGGESHCVTHVRSEETDAVAVLEIRSPDWSVGDVLLSIDVAEPLAQMLVGMCAGSHTRSIHAAGAAAPKAARITLCEGAHHLAHSVRLVSEDVTVAAAPGARVLLVSSADAPALNTRQSLAGLPPARGMTLEGVEVVTVRSGATALNLDASHSTSSRGVSLREVRIVHDGMEPSGFGVVLGVAGEDELSSASLEHVAFDGLEVGVVAHRVAELELTDGKLERITQSGLLLNEVGGLLIERTSIETSGSGVESVGVIAPDVTLDEVSMVTAGDQPALLIDGRAALVGEGVRIRGGIFRVSSAQGSAPPAVVMVRTGVGAVVELSGNLIDGAQRARELIHVSDWAGHGPAVVLAGNVLLDPLERAVAIEGAEAFERIDILHNSMRRSAVASDPAGASPLAMVEISSAPSGVPMSGHQFGGADVVNNVFVGSPAVGHAVRVDTQMALVAHHNLLDGLACAYGIDGVEVGASPSDILGDAGLEGDELRPRYDSVTRDAGVSHPRAPASGRDGHVRPLGGQPDIGAYER